MEELESRLHALRPILLAERGGAFRDLFDEFMQHREFELALHAVCDFILEYDPPQVSKSILDQIQRCHTMMKIDDRCVEEMRRHTDDSL